MTNNIASDDNEADYDMTKIESCFGVITHDKDCHIVTSELGITPTRSRQKGDESHSEYSARPAVAQYGIWEISRISMGECVSLAEHIRYYKDLLGEKLTAIENLKARYEFECVFYILVTTEDTVSGFDLSSDELIFISKLSSRFTYKTVSGVKL